MQLDENALLYSLSPTWSFPPTKRYTTTLSSFMCHAEGFFTLLDSSPSPCTRKKQRLWNQKTVYEALCCDCSEMTSQLFNFLSQNLSLVQSLFSGFGKIKKGSWIFLKKLVVQPLMRQLLLPSTGGRDSYIFLLLLLKFPKVENNKRFLFAVCFQNKAKKPNSQLFLYLTGLLSDFNLFGRA